MATGNVVKFNNSLYIVADEDYDWSTKKFNRMTLIPFDFSNCTTHLSSKHPFTMDICVDPKECDECDNDFNCSDDCNYCPNCKEVPNPELSIDNVKVVANNVNDFIMKKFKKMMYEDIK